MLEFLRLFLLPLIYSWPLILALIGFYRFICWLEKQEEKEYEDK